MPTPEENVADMIRSNAEVIQVGGQIKEIYAAFEAEVARQKAAGATQVEMPKEIAARLDDLDKLYTDANKRTGEIHAELQTVRDEKIALAARLDQWERLAGRPGNTFAAGQQSDDDKTAGQLVVEQLSKIDANAWHQAERHIAGASLNGMIATEQKSFLSSPGYGGVRRPPANIQAALGGDATPNFFVAPYQIPGWVPQATRRLTIRQLMPSFGTQVEGARTINYLRKRGFTTAAYSSVTSITRSGAVATVSQTAHGYDSYNIVEISSADQPEYNGVHPIVVVDANTYTYPVTGSPATPATFTSPATAIKARNMNAYGAAAFTAENTLKPEAAYVFDEHSAHVRTLAHFIKVTRQIMDDLPGLRQNIDFDLLYGLAFKEEQALLYGSGTGEQIEGITNVAGVQGYLWSQGKPDDIKWDAMRRARTRIELFNYTPDAVVINPLDWEDIETVKGTTGYYIYLQGMAGMSGLPVNANGMDIARLAVVVTPAIKAGTFVLGAWGATSAIYDRERANVRMTDSNEDDFVNNRLTILAEQREAAIWKVPEAFVVGSFDHAPTP